MVLVLSDPGSATGSSGLIIEKLLKNLVLLTPIKSKVAPLFYRYNYCNIKSTYVKLSGDATVVVYAF